MTDFVLVPGAWLGGWAWDGVAGVLRGAGHRVHPVTLRGLAERRGEDAGQQEHVADVVRVVEEHGLTDVVLVGHSYSGIPVGQAAGRIGERLRRVVYVDSNVPVDGQSFVDGWSAEGQAWVRDQLEQSGGVLAFPDGRGLRRPGSLRRGDRDDPGARYAASGPLDHGAGHPDAADRGAPDDVHQVPDGRCDPVVGGRRAPRLPVLATGGAQHRPLADVLPAGSTRGDPQRGRLSQATRCGVNCIRGLA
ncbi:alpha/beta fold hydrolase [Kribbella shirazensis]|uniref:alpha/beta fold hydrolase n=1 Tax=Kribbella shirazensis TaxID=1105143 RepID=UPI003B5249BC